MIACASINFIQIHAIEGEPYEIGRVNAIVHVRIRMPFGLGCVLKRY
jgi:hypothetical protein